MSELKSNSECRIVVADNGRIWVDGDISGIFNVRNTISKFVNENRRGEN